MRSRLTHPLFSRFRSLFLASALLLTLPIASARAQEGGGAPPDPAGGKFTLEQATKGVPGPATAPLVATIETSMGKLTCELYDKQAPITVANFVGLARGVRPWLDTKTNKWVTKKPFYDGLIFHRVIPGFMIQGGDPLGSGMGNPGYKFEDEISPDLKFDKPGLLAMANAGPGTNGSQFFVTVSTPNYLNNKHTIFGEVVQGMDIVEKISHVQTQPGDKPVKDVVIQKIDISEQAPKAAAAPSPAKK